MSTQFFGKYRGVVTDNQDPTMIGRIRARVADLGDLETGWATPCFPFGGAGMGFFALPKTGAGVWIEFEHGDPDYPIWSGCWYGAVSDVPSDVLAPPYKKVLIETEGGHKIILDDTPGVGGIMFETSGGQKLKLTATSIEIDNGTGSKIVMQGPTVKVNNGALEIM